MTWARLDDGFPEHPKVLSVGPFGLTVFVRALCYSARNLTDGFIPNAAIVSFTVDFARTSRAAHAVDWPARLVAAGLWDEATGGYRIHDYLSYNPSKEKVLAERKAVADRVKRWRADHRNAPCNGVTPNPRNAVSNGDVTGAVTPPPSPSPSPTEIEQVLSPPAGGPSRPPTPRAPREGPIDAYWTAFQARYGFAPTATKGEIAAAQIALRNVSGPDRASLLTAFVEDDRPFLCEAAHSLRLFPSELNRLKARLAGTLSPGRRPNPQRSLITPPGFRAEDEKPGTSKLDGLPVEEV